METSAANVRPVYDKALESPLTTFSKFCQLPDTLRSRVWESWPASSPSQDESSKPYQQPSSGFAIFPQRSAQTFGALPWMQSLCTVGLSEWAPGANTLEIFHTSKAPRNWTEPWLEAVHPPFTAREWEQTTPRGPIFEGLSLRRSFRLPKHVQQILASCREAREEFRKRYIRFSGSAKRSNLLILGERRSTNDLGGVDHFGGSSTATVQRKATMVANLGATHYQVDSEQSSSSYFDVRHDRLFIPTFEICDILDRWLPKQVFERLRFSIHQFNSTTVR